MRVSLTVLQNTDFVVVVAVQVSPWCSDMHSVASRHMVLALSPVGLVYNELMVAHRRTLSPRFHHISYSGNFIEFSVHDMYYK